MKTLKFWASWRGQQKGDPAFPCWERRGCDGKPVYFALLSAPGRESAWSLIGEVFDIELRSVCMQVAPDWAPCPMKFRSIDRIDEPVNA